MKQLAIPDKLRYSNHDIEGSDLQSESDLDIIRNSCDVCIISKMFFLRSSIAERII